MEDMRLEVFVDPEGNAQKVEPYHYLLVDSQPTVFRFEKVTGIDFKLLTERGYKLIDGKAVAPEEELQYKKELEERAKAEMKAQELEEENEELESTVDMLLKQYVLASLSNNKELMEELREEYLAMVNGDDEEEEEGEEDGEEES